MLASHEPAYLTARKETRIDVYACNDIWKRYDSIIFSDGYGGRILSPNAADFYSKKFAMGLLTDTQREKLLTCMETADIAPLQHGVNHPEYLENPVHMVDRDAVNRINREHRYYRIDARQLWSIWDVLDDYSEILSDVLGSSWRVLMIKSWRTDQASEWGMNQWHTDGCANSALKLMFYLTPLVSGEGGIEFQDSSNQILSVVAPAGSWVLFQNSHILHRGVAPTIPGKHRMVIEVTIGQALSLDTKPLFAGSNARHPYHPWSKPRFSPLLLQSNMQI